MAEKVQHGFVVNPSSVQQFRMRLQQGFGGQGMASAASMNVPTSASREISQYVLDPNGCDQARSFLTIADT